ncbi:MAG: dethiobiotin synthase [Alphaproteobacteria bacterium]
MIKGFFISGTDTNVGKTIVSSILVNKLSAWYYKPIQCGLSNNNEIDSDVVKKLTKNSRIIKETYFFKNPINPFDASLIEKKKIIIKKLIEVRNIKTNDKIIIEGAGGLYVPIKKNYLMIDLSKDLDLPLILVSRTNLGTINHTLMSLEIIRKRKIKFLGVIFVGKNERNTINTISILGKKILGKRLNILGRIPIINTLDQSSIKKLTSRINF